MAGEIAEIKVPTVGESITEVVVSQWLKPEGTWVEKDEPVVTLETDKVNVDVPAPVAGVLTKIMKSADATASVGEVIGQIDKSAKAGATASSAGKADKAGAAVAGEKAIKVDNKLAKKTAPTDDIKAMPAAERLSAEHGLNIGDIKGTGPGGRILKEDVQRHVVVQSESTARATPESNATASAASTGVVAAMKPGMGNVGGSRETEVVKMTPLRRRIAERLVMAQNTAAMLTTFNEIDMSAVMALRARHKDAFQAKYGIKLGFMSFFVKAAIDGLKAFPEINAQISGDNIVYHNYFDIGVAVDSDRGLVVPVLRNAESLSFSEVEHAIVDFGKRARDGKLKLEELQGGTFTISNGGVFGSMMSTPILNPPQSGILGMHAIQERPVGINGQIVLRPMMYVALSYDHRIVDGRGAVSFLKRLKECVEAPERMLLEI